MKRRVQIEITQKVNDIGQEDGIWRTSVHAHVFLDGALSHKEAFRLFLAGVNKAMLERGKE